MKFKVQFINTLFFIGFIFGIPSVHANTSADSIESLKADRLGRYYITLSSNRERLERWQTFTGKFLTTYATAVEPLVDFFIDQKRNQIIGITKTKLLFWDIYEAQVIQEMPLPPVTQRLLTANYKSIVDLRVSDFDENSGRLCIASGSHIAVMEITKGEIIYEGDMTYIVEQPLLMNNGQSLVGLEQVGNDVFKISLASGKRSSLHKGSASTQLTRRSQNEALLICDFGKWITLDGNFSKIKEEQSSDFLTRPPLFFGTTDFVTYSSGYVTMKLKNVVSDYRADFTNEFPIEGHTGWGNHFMMWKNKSLSTKQFSGGPVFYTEHYRSGINTVDAKAGWLIEKDSVLVLPGKIRLTHSAAITVYVEKGSSVFSADLKGNVYQWNKSGQLVNQFGLLSDAITTLTAVDENTIIGSSVGRALEYSFSTKSIGKVFRGHTDAISSVFMSPDNKILITTGRDKKLILFDRNSGQYLGSRILNKVPMRVSASPSNQLEVVMEDESKAVFDLNEMTEDYFNPKRTVLINSSHADQLTSLSFSPDGNSLLSADYTGTVRVWNVKNLVATTRFSNFSSLAKAKFTYDGKQVISFSSNTLYLNDALSGDLISSAEQKFFKNVFFHDIAVLGTNNGVLIANNSGKDQLFYTLNSARYAYAQFSEHEYSPFAIAVSPNMEVYATLSSDGIDFISLSDFQKVKEINYPNQSFKNMYAVRTLEFSPDGKMLAAEMDGKVVLFDTQSMRELQTIANSTKLKFSGKQEVIYYVRENRGAALVRKNLISGVEIFRASVNENIQSYQAIAYDSVNDMIALGSSKGLIELRDGRSGRILKSNKSEINGNSRGDFHPVTGELALGVPGGIKIFDVESAREKKLIPFQHGRFKMTPKVKYTSDGRYLIVSETYAGIYILDATTFDQLHKLPEAAGFHISADNKFLAVQHDIGGSISVYAIPGGERKTEISIDSKKAFVQNYFVSPNGAGLFFANREYKPQRELDKLGKFDKKLNDFLVYFDFAKNKITQSTPITTPDADHLQLSPDGQWIALQVDYRKIMFLNLQSQQPSFAEHPTSIDFMQFTHDSKQIIVANREGEMIAYDVNTQKPVHALKKHQAEIRSLAFYNGTMASFSEDGTSILWNLQSSKPIVQLSSFSSNDYIFLNSQNYYTGTKGISNTVFFKKGNEVYSFDQYDLVYNRPDLVIQELGATPEKVKAYSEAYRKRIKNLGFDIKQLSDAKALPQILVKAETNAPTTAKKILELELIARDENAMIDRLNVWVNDVPVYGVKGLSVKAENKKLVTKKIALPLTAGENTIKVSCHNVNGLESLRETFAISHLPVELPKPNLYLVAISVSDYRDNNFDLKYARKDGSDLMELFRQQAGNFANVYIDTVFDQQAVLETIPNLKKKLLNTGVEDQVIVFAAGHGVLDKNFDFYFGSYDMDFRNPALRGIPYDAIEGLLDGIPARKKLLLIDACHSGEVDKEGLVEKQAPKATKVAPTWRGAPNSNSGLGLSNSFELMQELFANLSKGSGAVVISAAAGDQYAEEREEFRNGVFTYCVKTALTKSDEGIASADFNKDGNVSVSELKSFVSAQVEEMTNGKQRPTSRRENLELDFSVWK